MRPRTSRTGPVRPPAPLRRCMSTGHRGPRAQDVSDHLSGTVSECATRAGVSFVQSARTSSIANPSPSNALARPPIRGVCSGHSCSRISGLDVTFDAHDKARWGASAVSLLRLRRDGTRSVSIARTMARGPIATRDLAFVDIRGTKRISTSQTICVVKTVLVSTTRMSCALSLYWDARSANLFSACLHPCNSRRTTPHAQLGPGAVRRTRERDDSGRSA